MALVQAGSVVSTMTDEEAPARYYLFKCRSPGCEGIIPVEFRLSLNNSYDCIFLLKKKTGDINNGMAPVYDICPLCNHMNHFLIRDSFREMTCSEYEIARERARSTRQDIISPGPIFR